MATNRDIYSSRIPYGYAGAKFPDLSSARRMAKINYERAVKDAESQGKKVKETFDQALVMEETSVYLNLTYVNQ
ncbi:MAG: hypothetical protein IKI57_00110 [Clostridia bacterium]|nr:hypothetical protein [Clostridia bacterium]